jgi:hypothetical protein
VKTFYKVKIQINKVFEIGELNRCAWDKHKKLNVHRKLKENNFITGITLQKHYFIYKKSVKLNGCSEQR